MNEIVEAQSGALALTPEMAQMLAESAKEQSSNEISGIPFLSIKGSKFTLNDTRLGQSIDVVILATAFDNAYYDRDYDPDVITPPACFAISIDKNFMAPHETAPVQQAESCQGCPQNEFETAKNGKGKACKNGRRLLLAGYNTETGEADLEQIVILRLPPTSLKPFASYAKTTPVRTKLPLWAMVTNLSMDPETDWPRVLPTFKQALTQNSIVAIHSRLSEFEESVQTPYDVTSYIPPEEISAEEATSKASKKSKMS